MVQLLGKKVWMFVINLTTFLPYEAAIPLVGPYLREMNTPLYKKTYRRCSQQL